MDEPLALITPTEKFYYHANHLYSVAALTDSAGSVVERYRYDTYGNRTVLAPDGITTRTVSSYNQQIGFTGRYLDKETGLWYFRARYYSGSLGRFVSRDFNPRTDIGAKDGYEDGFNFYSAYFVPGGVDPTGHLFTHSTTYPNGLSYAISVIAFDANFTESEWMPCAFAETFIMNTLTALIPVTRLGTLGAAVAGGASATCCTCMVQMRHKTKTHREWKGVVEVEVNLFSANKYRTKTTGVGPIEKSLLALEFRQALVCTTPYFSFKVPLNWTNIYSEPTPKLNAFPTGDPIGIWSPWAKTP